MNTQVIAGDIAHNYDAITVSGVRQLQQGDYLSLWVYSQRDQDFTIQSNNGGFSAAQIDADNQGVSAAVICNGGGKTKNVRQVGWVELGACDGGEPGWTTDGSFAPGLFSFGNNFDPNTGRFTVSEYGMYFTSGKRLSLFLPRILVAFHGSERTVGCQHPSESTRPTRASSHSAS